MDLKLYDYVSKMSLDKQKFLCICDVIITDIDSLTFEELKLWSDYVTETPVRALYAEGRKLSMALSDGQKFDTMKSVVELIDILAVAAYIGSSSREEHLMGLGEIFEVLGGHSNILLSNPKYGEMINDYVSFFSIKEV